jgi:hypothetical protein
MGNPAKLLSDKKLETLEKKLIQALQKDIARQLQTSGEIRKIIQEQLRPGSSKTKTKSPSAGK